MGTAPSHFFKQSGVVPYRITSKGLRILLITSARKQNWTIPKGVVEPDLTPEESAVKEAFEEAGITGSIYAPSIGKYELNKWGNTARIKVYLFKVKKVLDDWPEESFRTRKWMSVEGAASRVRNEDLREILESVPKHIRKGKVQKV